MMEEHTQQHYQNQYTVTDQGTTEDFSQCDCIEGIKATDTEETPLQVEALVIIRSKGKLKEKKVDSGEKSEDGIDCKDQDKVRMKILREIQQNQQAEGADKPWETEEINSVLKNISKTGSRIQQKSFDKPESSSKPSYDKGLSDDLYEALLNAPISVKVGQLLKLVPDFTQNFFRKLTKFCCQ